MSERSDPPPEREVMNYESPIGQSHLDYETGGYRTEKPDNRPSPVIEYETPCPIARAEGVPQGCLGALTALFVTGLTFVTMIAWAVSGHFDDSPSVTAVLFAIVGAGLAINGILITLSWRRNRPFAIGVLIGLGIVALCFGACAARTLRF